MSTSTTKNIQIGVSSCLLGHKVRYDGQDKKHHNVLKLCEQFTCIAICPEVAIDLGVPRPPIHLVQLATEIHALGIANPQQDFTDALKDYASNILESFPTLCGYVFKARSPSCGVNSTPLFDAVGKQQLDTTNGIFSGQLKQLARQLPVTEEAQLETEEELQKFTEEVITYSKLTRRSN